MEPRYKLVAIDLDGTLLDDQKNIPEKNIEAIRRAVSRGVHVMLATGRPYRAAQWVFEKAGIREGLILSQAGSLVSRYPGETTVCGSRHDPAFLRELAQFCEERGLFFHCMLGSDYYYLREDPMADLIAFYLGYRGTVVSLEELIRLNTRKATIVMPPEQTDGVLAEVRQRFGGRAELAKGDPIVIDITPPGVNKGTALLKAAAILGVRQEEVMAIGDSENDLPMLRAAGLGVCMENGVQSAKDAAGAVVPSNNDAGVAYAIETFVLLS